MANFNKFLCTFLIVAIALAWAEDMPDRSPKQIPYVIGTKNSFDDCKQHYNYIAIQDKKRCRRASRGKLTTVNDDKHLKFCSKENGVFYFNTHEIGSNKKPSAAPFCFRDVEKAKTPSSYAGYVRHCGQIIYSRDGCIPCRFDKSVRDDCPTACKACKGYSYCVRNTCASDCQETCDDKKGKSCPSTLNCRSICECEDKNWVLMNKDSTICIRKENCLQ